MIILRCFSKLKVFESLSIPSFRVSATRQIIPKLDSPAQPGAPATQANNIIIPQGIQHVLINGQLYPIIQTANGTHLLIQQPVGQIQQNGGKQVFTAQPIQLNNQPIQPAQTQGSTQPSLGPVVTAALAPATTTNPSTVLSQHNAPTATQTSATTNTIQLNPISAASSQPSTSSASASTVPAPATGAPVPQQTAQIYLPNQYNVQTPVTVSPHTQQVLSKIQAQIEVLKPKADSDAAVRNSLTQLQNIQQQILNELRNQMHAVQQRQQSANQAPANPLVHPGEYLNKTF